MKHARNHRGFSLVELLIAITILGIVAMPLFRAFVTSAGTAARSSRLGDATLAAQNTAEAIAAADLSTLQADLQTALQAADAQQQNDGDTYRVDLSGVTAGRSTYNVRVTLEANPHAFYAAVNNVEITDYSPMDGVLPQARTPAEHDPDAVAESKYQSTAAGYTLHSKSRTIRLKTEKSGSNFTAEVFYEYAYKYTYTTYNEEGQASTHAGTFTDSMKFDLFPQGYDLSRGAPNLYLLYYPVYQSDGWEQDEIIVQNPDDVKFHLFLVKQWDPGRTDQAAKESTYSALLSLRQNCGFKDGATIYSNAKQHLTTGAAIAAVHYRIYRGAYTYTNGALGGELVRKTAKNRLYAVQIDLYTAAEAAGEPVYSLRTTKLQ